MTNMVGLGDDTWPLCYLLGDFSLEISRIKVNHQIRSTLKSPFLGGFKQSLPHWFGSWWFGNSKGHLHIYTPHIYRNRFHRQSLGRLWLLSCESKFIPWSCTTSTDIWRGQLNDLAIYLQRLCKAFHSGSGGVMCCEFCANDVRPSPFLVRKVIFLFNQ